MHWRRKWQPTPVFLPGESQRQGSLVGCRLWGRTESDTTERLHFHCSLSLFMHWRRKWQPTPVFLPGESQRQGSLVGCRLWGRTESDTASLVAQMVKNLPAMWETWVRSLIWEDPLEEGMATHSSVLAWRVPWTEEPHRLKSMGSQRAGHD